MSLLSDATFMLIVWAVSLIFYFLYLAWMYYWRWDRMSISNPCPACDAEWPKHEIYCNFFEIYNETKEAMDEANAEAEAEFAESLETRLEPLSDEERLAARNGESEDMEV